MPSNATKDTYYFLLQIYVEVNEHPTHFLCRTDIVVMCCYVRTTFGLSSCMFTLHMMCFYVRTISGLSTCMFTLHMRSSKILFTVF